MRAISSSRTHLPDERRHAHDEVPLVGVAHEGEAPQAGEGVLAARPPLVHHRVQPPARGPERGGVAVVAAHLPAEGHDVAARLLARVEREALHGVQVHVEARPAPAHGLVQAARARHHAARPPHVHAAALEPGQIAFDLRHEARVCLEGLAARAPALRLVVARTGCAQRVVAVERECTDDGVRRVELTALASLPPSRARHPRCDCAGPGLGERHVAVGDEPLGVAETVAHGSARTSRGARAAGLGRPRPHGCDDQRPEARTETVLVDSDDGVGPFLGLGARQVASQITREIASQITSRITREIAACNTTRVSPQRTHLAAPARR
jgi:hypothetical protein